MRDAQSVNPNPSLIPVYSPSHSPAAARNPLATVRLLRMTLIAIMAYTQPSHPAV